MCLHGSWVLRAEVELQVYMGLDSEVLESHFYTFSG